MSFFFGTIIMEHAKFEVEGDIIPTFSKYISSHCSYAWYLRESV